VAIAGAVHGPARPIYTEQGQEWQVGDCKNIEWMVTVRLV
jgi:hypothetical protein